MFLERWNKYLLLILYLTGVSILFFIIKPQDLLWKWTHIFFDYHFGFLKRGLIGSMFNLLDIEPTLKTFTIFSYLLLILFISVNFLLISSRAQFKYFFALLFLTSPLLFKNVVLDLGRFDIFALILILIFLLNLGKKNILFWLPPLLFIIPLIHEGSLVWAHPFILAVLFIEYKKLFQIALGTSILAFSILMLYGSPKVSTEQFENYFKTKTDISQLEKSGISTLYITPGEGFLHFKDRPSQVLSTKKGLVSLIIVLSSLGLLLLSKRKDLLVPLILSHLAIIPLFYLGYDFFRWFSLMGFINYFSIIYLSKKDLDINGRILKRYLIILSIIYLFLPPIGIY